MKRCIVLVMIFSVLFIPLKVDGLSLSAKSAVLINGDNGEIIFQNNAHQRLPMASTTKIMTALLLCEYGNFEKEITVTAEMLKVEGSSMGLLAGDKVTLRDLLYGLMLASGNDAANVIAFTVGGSLEGFAKLMNAKAKELGLKSTSFATPSGLDAENHYTTAYELAKLTLIAMQNAEFSKAVACERAVLNYGNPPYKRALSNHNKLLKMYDGAVGVKTGFTKKSGRCLVSAAKRDGKFLIAVTLDAPNDWSDHKQMLDYGFSAIKQTDFSPMVNNYNIPVINGKSEALNIEIKPFKINSLETENIECRVFLPRFVYAPVCKGELIGKAVYLQNGKYIGEIKLSSQQDILITSNQKSGFSTFLDIFRHIIDNI